MGFTEVSRSYQVHYTHKDQTVGTCVSSFMDLECISSVGAQQRGWQGRGSLGASCEYTYRKKKPGWGSSFLLDLLKPWQWGEPCHCHLFPGVPLCGSTLWCHCQHCPHPLLSPGPHPGALPARLQQQSLLHHVLHTILTGPATAAQRHAAVPTAPIPTVPAPAEAVQPARYQMCPPTTDVLQNWAQWEPGL